MPGFRSFVNVCGAFWIAVQFRRDIPRSSSFVGLAAAVIRITATMTTDKHTVLETIVKFTTRTFNKPTAE